jgi:hypothetical protein
MLRDWFQKSKNFFQKQSLQQFLQKYMIPLAGVLLMLGLWAALTISFDSSQDTGVLEKGAPSPVTIRARRSAEFISDVQTAAARAQAESRPENLVYTTDFELPAQQKRKLEDLLNSIGTVRSDPTLNHSEQLQKLQELSNPTVVLSSTLAEDILDLDTDSWDDVRNRVFTLYDRAVSQNSFEITEETLHRLRERTLPYWTSHLEQPEKDLVRFFTSSFLRVNRTLDQQATQQRKTEARDSVEAVKVQVHAGENIVRVGDVVTAETIEKARATRALPNPLSLMSVLGRGIISALLALSFMLYLVFTQKEIVQQTRPLMVIVIALIITAMAARLLQPLWLDQPYAFPLATTILVLVVLFNLQIALAGAVLVSIVIGVMDGNTLAISVTLLLGSATAAFSVRGADRPLTFLLAGIGVAVSTILTQMAFCWVDSGRECMQEFWTIFLFSGTNGGLSAILSLGLFNLVGNSAGIVTPLKLMELAHPSQPLLRKLIHEAPGTYYHSIAVSNLAEAAADAIGADALLLRVGAYYHDIGKTLRPFFFTDNQMGRENVHNELDPHTSAEIIIDHVRDGLKMAKSANLPEQIVDFISTHHGTHLVGHFYQIALREEDSVNINHFRYPGPRPWTREQGILMLADSVEATVRSKAQHGKLISERAKENGAASGGGVQTVEELVNSIIDDRVRSGQLDDTPLTLRDLVLIREAFIKSLKSIYHPRTEYVRPLVKAQ